MPAKRQSAMGTLAEALRQLDGRSPESPAAAIPHPQGESVAAADSISETTLAEPEGPSEPAIESSPYSTDKLDASSGVGEDSAAASLFIDPSFNRALEFADAALAAADAADVAQPPLIWPAFDAAEPERKAAQGVTGSSASAVASDPLATVSIDRSYGRLWDSLTAALLNSPPWAIVVAGADARDDARWVLPMAVAFAQRQPGQVLLVDGSQSIGGAASSSIARRGLTEQMGLACRFGLIDVLRSKVDWRSAIEPTAVPRIGLLASGFLPAGECASATYGTAAANLIAELKSSYQLVLIHAPDAADPLVPPLVSACDGTLLMLALGQTLRAAAEKASSSLYVAGARLLGCVVRD